LPWTWTLSTWAPQLIRKQIGINRQESSRKQANLDERAETAAKEKELLRQEKRLLAQKKEEKVVLWA
jgi:hypothetical protein